MRALHACEVVHRLRLVNERGASRTPSEQGDTHFRV